jgi:hypothetical protein
LGFSIQQNQTAMPLTFKMFLSSDHLADATGKTPTVTIRKVGGAFATPAGAVTEVGNGFYEVAPNAADANTLGPLLLKATAADCDPCSEEFLVVAYNPFAVAGLGLTNLDAAVSSRMATYVQPAGFLAATFPTDPADQSLVIAAADALSALLTAVKAKTDSLTFTQAGHVDANVQRVNDVAVAGTGATGDEWGPA